MRLRSDADDDVIECAAAGAGEFDRDSLGVGEVEVFGVGGGSMEVAGGDDDTVGDFD